MTVEQLIAVLQKMPQESIVKIEMIHPDWYQVHAIQKVYVSEDKTIRLAWIY